jgi:hypothetical protein
MAKRPETAQTGVKASVWLKEACNELNWVCNPFIEDFGIDFHVKAFESTAQRRALPCEFYVQVKGTTNLRRAVTGRCCFPSSTAPAEADNISTGHTLRTQNLIREPVNQRGRSVTDAAITDKRISDTRRRATRF